MLHQGIQNFLEELDNHTLDDMVEGNSLLYKLLLV